MMSKMAFVLEFLTVFERPAVSDPPFDHHRDHIDFPVWVHPRFAFWNEACVGQIDEDADARPSGGINVVPPCCRVHHQPMLSQTGEASQRKVIPMQDLDYGLFRFCRRHELLLIQFCCSVQFGCSNGRCSVDNGLYVN